VLHVRLVEHDAQAGPLSAQEHVRYHVEIVREREVLVDDLDAESGRVPRAVDRHRLPLEPNLALVEGMDPDHALDQRRLSGAVVADERHHLAATDLEVDPVERADRPEGLRHADALEQRGVSHRPSSSSSATTGPYGSAVPGAPVWLVSVSR
jgi:hypothetical protein